MKKNKGFTLVELLAVIVILGILVGIAVPIFYNISKNIKENEYYAKKKYIEELAVRYAEENSVLIDESDEFSIITPVKLISAGVLSAEKYITLDDGEIPFIENPTNINDNLVCHVITLRIEDYNYYAEFSDNDTDCYLSSKEVSESRVGLKAYEIKDDNTLDNEMTPSVNNYFKWTKNDIVLVINPVINYSIISYDIGGRNYTINKSNMFSGSAYGLSLESIQNYSNVIVIKGIEGAEISSEYKFTIRGENEEDIYFSTIHVRIDKRSPRIDNYQSELWTNNKLETIIYINDGDGSGSKGLCYSKDNNIGNATCVDVENMESIFKSKSVKINGLENGNVYIWPIDIVGNEPRVPSIITIKNVDINNPSFEGIEWVIDSDISCDNGIQCINPSDTNCTCRKIINGQRVSDSIIYDRSRTAKIKYSDNQSGVKKVNYCITSDDTCDPNNEIYGVFVGGNMEASVKWTDSELGQKVCYHATDNVGNNSDLKCTDKYNVNENYLSH